jgi:SAM-dependent methyltransferase
MPVQPVAAKPPAIASGRPSSAQRSPQRSSLSISEVSEPEGGFAQAGEKAKARDLLAAIRTLKAVEQQRRPPSAEERQVLARFCGFGPVALSIFPDPLTGCYKDASWQTIGEELRSLLSEEEYASARRTTFNAFYTSSTVIKAMFQALKRSGIPDSGLVLEPGCGPGRFLYLAPKGMRFIGVELDSISGRIAQALHPGADIRIENFRDSRLPQLDAVIGNVPFADRPKLEHGGQRYSLHDYFFAKSVDALKPGGVLALVTSHFTLDKICGRPHILSFVAYSVMWSVGLSALTFTFLFSPLRNIIGC